MLRVALDMRATEPEFKAHHGRGTGRYAKELSAALGQLVAREGDIMLHPLRSSELGGTKFQKNCVALSPAGRTTLRTQFLVPQALRRSGCDLVHFFAHGDAPARGSVPYLVTVLDLIPLRFPELYKANKPSWRFHLARFLEKKAILGATGILAISEATKRDVVEIMGIPAERIVVTPLAVGEEFSPRALDGEFIDQMQAERRAFALPECGPLLLYVGGIDARKNIRFLLETFRELLDSFRGGERPRLVLAGGIERDDHFPELKRALSELGIEEHVNLLGFVSDQKLPALYRAANCLVFPSLYEGFGFPVLEAMACGVPVIAGNNSSLPEVAGTTSAGDTGAILLPDNARSNWVSELNLLLTSTERQRELGKLGVRRAREFSWKQTAEKTLEAYRKFGLPRASKGSGSLGNKNSSDNVSESNKGPHGRRLHESLG